VIEIRLDQCVLGHVFGLCVISDNEVGDPQGDPLMCSYQLLEGSGVTISRSRDHFSFVQWTALHGMTCFIHRRRSRGSRFGGTSDLVAV